MRSCYQVTYINLYEIMVNIGTKLTDSSENFQKSDIFLTATYIFHLIIIHLEFKSK